jgi:hypothetical protein
LSKDFHISNVRYAKTLKALKQHQLNNDLISLMTAISSSRRFSLTAINLCFASTAV